MWKELIKFEFSYRKNRPATYIYFLVLFVFAFLIVTTPMVEIFASGEINQNSPYLLFILNSLFSVISIFIISAIMGVAIIRDFEHKTESIFFTTNITKKDYLIGRFLGSLIVLLLILTAIPLGFMLGDVMPWREAHRMGSFRLYSYWSPYFTVLVPNAIILGTLFFCVGALSRKMIVVLMQGVLVFMLTLLSSQLVSNLDNQTAAALVDPTGVEAAEQLTKYWSIDQKNFSDVKLEGLFLNNRLLWLAIAFVFFAISYSIFSLKTVLNPIRKSKAAALSPIKEKFNLVKLGDLTVTKNFSKGFSKIIVLTKIYFAQIVKSLPFIFLVLCGVAFYIFDEVSSSGMYGVKTIPSTYIVLNNMEILTGLFTLVLAIMFTGNLVWEERELKMNLIQDSMPIKNWVPLLSKLLALLGAISVIFLLSIFLGVSLQLIKGFDNIELGLYIKSIFGDKLLSILVFTLVSFFVHVVVNNKFLGHALLIFLLLSRLILRYLKVESPLAMFNSGSLGQFSEMNKFGHAALSFSWLKFYWVSFAALLFIIASLVTVRGTEEKIKTRLQIGKFSLNRKVITALLALIIFFVSSGSYIYYNNRVLNEHKTEKEQIANRVAYEKTLKKFENIAQPKIVDVKVNVDLYPETRDFKANGQYWLKNKSKEDIAALYIDLNKDHQNITDSLSVNRDFTVDNQYYKDFGLSILNLKAPLKMGDSLQLYFEHSFATNGIEEGRGDLSVVYNGTFINNNYFPALGYNVDAELSDENKRIENDLPKKERIPKRDTPNGRLKSYMGDDADFYSFEATVSTTENQIAIAPGYLQKEWKENGRRYFSYKMDAPIKNMYSIVSADYAVKKEKYKGISLEIYYYPKHTYNIDRMLTAMKNSLDYYQEAFGPYQFRQLRIMEFPLYKGFAQSFANTIPFGENMGFISDIDDEKDVDMPTFVTAHEIAHQWWGHQTMGAYVQGSSMASESFAEYSALMVMYKNANAKQKTEFNKHEINTYLRGRSGEDKKELPLAFCENQSYIHYYKGSMVLNLVKDFIGEKALNQSLKNYLIESKKGIEQEISVYPTSKDYTDELLKHVPDSLSYLVEDLFNKIVLYDLKTETASYKKVGELYEVTFNINAKKVYADESGKETEKPFKEWIWVGVKGENDKEFMYYKRHLIKDGQQKVKVLVKEIPKTGGIDPMLMYIDRHIDDNSITIKEE